MSHPVNPRFDEVIPPLQPLLANVPRPVPVIAPTRAKRTPPIDPQGVTQRIKMVVGECASVREAAEKCGIPQPTMETYLQGLCLPGTLAIARLCHGLSISADWLLFGELAK